MVAQARVMDQGCGQIIRVVDQARVICKTENVRVAANFTRVSAMEGFIVTIAVLVVAIRVKYGPAAHVQTYYYTLSTDIAAVS